MSESTQHTQPTVIDECTLIIRDRCATYYHPSGARIELTPPHPYNPEYRVARVYRKKQPLREPLCTFEKTYGTDHSLNNDTRLNEALFQAAYRDCDNDDIWAEYKWLPNDAAWRYHPTGARVAVQDKPGAGTKRVTIQGHYIKHETIWDKEYAAYELVKPGTLKEIEEKLVCAAYHRQPCALGLERHRATY